MAKPKSVVELFQAGACGHPLAHLGRMRVFEPGQSLFGQGEQCFGIYIVVSGVIGLRCTSEDGVTALVQLCRSGQSLGQAAFLGATDHAASAEALTLSRVRFIDRAQLTGACASDERVSRVLLQNALADLDQAQSRCAGLLTRDLTSRLIDILLSFHDVGCPDQDGDVIAIDLPIQRKDLAALIGAAPESLSRLIGKLEENGSLRVEGRRMYLSKRLTAHAHPMKASAATEKMLSALMQARSALLALLDTDDAAARRRLERKIEKASSDLDALLDDARAGKAPFAASFSAVWQQFKQTRQCEIIPAARSGRIRDAREIALGVQAERLALMKQALAAA